MRPLTFILAAMVTAPLLPQQPRPTSEIQRLSRLLVGSWTTTEKHEPGDIAPHGGIGRGSERDYLGPGATSLIADYRSVDPSGDFVAHTVMWWDPKEQAYRSISCHNRASACGVRLWRWEGGNLVSREEGTRYVWTDWTPTSHTFYMEVSSGRSIKRLMTIRYHRRS